MIRNLLISGVLASTAIGLAAPANADQYDFISALDSQGIYYSSVSDMIDLGKATCTVVRRTNNVNIAIAGLTRAGYTSSQERGAILMAAANNMCPDIWGALDAHMRQSNPSPPPPAPPPPDEGSQFT